ncbi:hypothetical protein M422DRAFT_267922 [Sphaerobolus stellatus SS14]|uniref:Uncharacterized protein n=1 Tax=Sphaerobolus stellatus (strain SS14) TaxID=990650 RepID=A0A0C9UYM3_SPHS4|nr:hypothetical protein M422DRAFT_267922 [Sphaerobolus stellatus SS14]
MLERAYGTMILQDFYLRKQNEALHKKEKKEGKKTDRRKILFSDGFGRHMTDTDFIRALEADKQSRVTEQQQKARKRAAKADFQVIKKELEIAWEKLKEDHRKVMDTWKADVEYSKALGKRGGDLPEKPTKLILKATFSEQFLQTNTPTNEDTEMIGLESDSEAMEGDEDGEAAAGIDWDSEEE